MRQDVGIKIWKSIKCVIIFKTHLHDKNVLAGRIPSILIISLSQTDFHICQ